MIHPRNAQILWSTLPIVFMLQLPPLPADGFGRTLDLGAGLVALMATLVLVHFGSRRFWTPLIRRAGFWTAAVVLGFALAAAAGTVVALSLELGAMSFALKLLSQSVIMTVLFSWCHAAFCQATEARKT